MKKHIKAIGGILLGAILVLGGCSNIFSPPENAAQDAAGNVLIRLGHGEDDAARTLTPSFTGLSYELAFSGPASHGNETAVLNQAKAITLEEGTWTITATAKQGTTQVAGGSWKGNVASGKTSDVSIQLKPLDGKGTFTCKVTFPNSVTSAQLTLTPDEGTPGTPETLTSGVEKTIGSLNAGAYLLNITLSDGSKNAARTETVHIYPALTSSAVYTFTGSEFTLLDSKLPGVWSVGGDDGWLEVISITQTGSSANSVGSFEYRSESTGGNSLYAGDIVWAEAFDDSSGVIIIKYDAGKEQSWWSGDDPTGNYFGIYYSGISGGALGSTAEIFGTSDQQNNSGPTETTTLSEAIARFTLAKKDLWISSSAGSAQKKFSIAPPPAPAVTATGTVLSVSWNAVSGATGYEVYWHTADKMSDIPAANKLDISGGATTTATISSGLATTGIPYYVWVKAKNASGSSPYSLSASGILPLTLPSWLNGSFNAHINGYTPPGFYDDGFEVNPTAKTFFYFGDSTRTTYWGGTIAANITNAGTTADPHILIVKITANSGGFYDDTQTPAVNNYIGVAYTDFGVYTTSNYANKYGGAANSGKAALAEALSEYTMANGYYGSMNAYARYYPVSVTKEDIEAFQGTWVSDDDEYLTLTIAGIAVGYVYDDDGDGTWDYMSETNNGMGQIVDHTDLSADKGLLYVANQYSDDNGSDGFFILAWHWTDRTNGKIEWELLDDDGDVWDMLAEAQGAYADAESVDFSLGFTRP